MAEIEIKPGDIWARVSHGEVVSINGDSIVVKNDKVGEWSINRSIVEKEFQFAGRIDSYVEVRPTEFERIFKESVGSNVFEVKFTKKPSDADGVEIIDKAGWAGADQRKKRKVVRDVLEGEERILVGRLDINAYRSVDYDPETLGRMQVIDMREDPKSRRGNKRQVDLRTIKYLTVGGVCYHTAKNKPE